MEKEDISPEKDAAVPEKEAVSSEKTNKRENKGVSPLYRLVRWFVRLFFPKMQLSGEENLPKEPCVIVGNHSQLYGPVSAELYLPFPHRTWCIGEMMDRKTVPPYAFEDFWSRKPRALHWFYRILSHLIAPVSELIFTNARTIGVYHDSRLVKTFRESMDALGAGGSIVIFPECYDEHNHIVHEFQDHFVDLARMYHRRTGKELRFVPLYVAPRLETLYFGEPVSYRADRPAEEERRRVCGALMDRITQIAVSLPEHTVVPYPNISKKEYPTNLSSVPMRLNRPRVDYSGFSLRRLNEPRFAHVWLLGGWLVYFAMYLITENLIPFSACHVIHCEIDDLIPFHEFFVIFYVAWYLLVFTSLADSFFHNVEQFRRIQTFIMITQALAMIWYVLYPSRQELRPEYFERENLLTWIMGLIYAFDTPTGICPSLHVAYSVGILSAALKDKECSYTRKAGLAVFVVMICASVCFVKQHSFVDVVAAVPVCAVAEAAVYGKSYWLPRWRQYARSVRDGAQDRII